MTTTADRHDPGPATRFVPLGILALLAAAGGCRGGSRPAPAGRAEAAPSILGDAAVPTEAVPRDVVVATPPEPAAPIEPPADKVPPGVAPWLSYADTPVVIVDADGSRPAAVGDPVLPGSVVMLESWGQAELDFPDGSAADLDELTELFVRAVVVQGGLRQLELTVFDGNVRTVVAPSAESGSVFRVATPVGVVEAARAEFAVEVDGATGATRVLVLRGTVRVQSGEAERELTGAGSAPAAIEIPGPGALREVEAAPAWVSRWIVWDDRQADRLLHDHGIDLANPGGIASTALSTEAHPGWATTIRLRRARIEARAAALAEALGPDGPPTSSGPREKLAAARDAYGGKTGNPHVTALEPLRAGRAELWAARAGSRAERQGALRDTMAQLRGAYLEHAAPLAEPVDAD